MKLVIALMLASTIPLAAQARRIPGLHEEVVASPAVQAVEEHKHFPADLGVLVDPATQAPAMFVLASVANGATDWKFTGPITGRQYNVSAKQQVAVTGAVIGAALVVRHVWPKSAKVVNALLYIGAGAYAGKAYANTLNRGAK